MTGSRGGGERGSVSAEFATALPAVLLVLVFALAALGAGVAQLRAYDGARAGAREAAIGAGETRIVAVAREVAGEAATVSVQGGGTVRVTVALPVAGLDRLGVFDVHATAVAIPEP